MRIECLCGTNPHRFYLRKPFFKLKYACAVKPEVPKSWSLEMDYSRAPCLGADQRTRGLWERDCQSVYSNELDACAFQYIGLGNWRHSRFFRELTNRRLPHDGAVGSPYSPASSSCRNLNLRFALKTTTFMRDRQLFSPFLKFVFIF